MKPMKPFDVPCYSNPDRELQRKFVGITSGDSDSQANEPRKTPLQRLLTLALCLQRADVGQ